MSNDIAIIGMSGRFPGANTTDELWENILNKKCSINKLNKEDCLQSGIENSIVNHKNYVFAKGVLENSDKFDAEFFKFSSSQASILDPQYRHMLEVAYEAIESAGYGGSNKPDNFGVFVGSSCMDTYYKNVIKDNLSSFRPNGFFNTIYNSKDFLPTLISYKLGLSGPSIAIQTACSSSLVSVCMACQSLISLDSDIAIAGGTCITTPINAGYLFEPGMMLSQSGICSSFDKSADGIVLGNGLGAVVLKRLDDAINDNDFILATIKGFATNNDGSNKIGYTAPSIDGQVKVIEKAIRSANINKKEIQYIESHGTGTILGDQLELEALNSVFKDNDEIALGAIKPNIGHLDAASGITNLIKVIYVLNKGIIPPNINFDKNNQHDQLNYSPFKIHDEKKHVDINIASTSSFGIGGTNAHVILQKYNRKNITKSTSKYHFLILSAKTTKNLNEQKIRLAKFLRNSGDISLGDIAYTLQTGRECFKYRAVFQVSSIKKAIKILESEKLCNTNKEPYVSWFDGDDLDWSKFNNNNSDYQKVPLPSYPFSKKQYWFTGSEYDTTNERVLSNQMPTDNNFVDAETKITNIFIKYLSEENSVTEENICLDANLSELGFDSILSIMIKADIYKDLKIKIPFNIDADNISIRKLCKKIINHNENI